MRWKKMMSGLALVGLLSFGAWTSSAQEKPKADRGKFIIEIPTVDIVQTATPIPVAKQKPADPTKSFVIERAPKEILVNSTAPVAPPAPPAPVAEKKGADPTKRLMIERAPTNILVNNAAPVTPVIPKAPRPRLDVTKGAVIERAPLELLAARTAAANNTPKRKVANPKVEPGKVKWHATFEAACAASKKSGKPVLLFQMMGKLDDQFC